MQLELIEAVDRLREILPAWSAFTETVEGLTPFQSPEWLTAWWHHFGSGKLLCFLFRKRDEVVGIVPCFLHEWEGRRQLTLVGAGISDYLEPAMKPECAEEIVHRLRHYLDSTSNWDVCDWQDLSLDSPLQSLASEVCDDSPCRVIPLEKSFEEYWNDCARSLRQNVRRDKAKAEALGEVRFDVTNDASPDLLDTLIEMHAARWQRKNQPGMIQGNGSAEFIRDIARQFAHRDMLRIFSIRFNEKIAAIIVAFTARRRISNYLTAFDPFHERLGFGRTLLYESIRHSFQNGCQAWDFLRGDEPYKLWWRAQKIPKIRLRVTRTA